MVLFNKTLPIHNRTPESESESGMQIFFVSGLIFHKLIKIALNKIMIDYIIKSPMANRNSEFT